MPSDNDNAARAAARAEHEVERLASPCGRAFKSSVPPQTLAAIQKGVLRTTYRGRAFLKSPFDIVLYLRLIEQLRPRTIVEIGSKQGGSALWFADSLQTFGIDARVISIDLEPPSHLADPRITFFGGDAAALGAVLDAELIAKLPHPWLVSEDSAHCFAECLAVLRFFDPHLRPGDYIVIEDGIVSDLPDRIYRKFDNGPNRAIAAFLSERRHSYVIDADLCDLFGYNATYNPNGWLRRIR